MKKIVYLIIVLLLPTIVFAEGIDKYYINATIENDGSLLVEEYFTLTGYYNGFERKIYYANSSAATFNINASSYGGSTIHNGTGIELISVGSTSNSFSGDFSSLDIDTFTYDDTASSGDYGVYYYNNLSKGIEVTIFNPSKKNTAFYIKYRIKNMAILFNDVAELGWNAVGDEFSEDIDYLSIVLNIPNNSNDLRAWAHGPLNGLVEINSKEKVTFTVTNLSSGTAVDIRSTFDRSIISNSTKKYNTNALDKILVYEEEQAKKANSQREKLEKQNEETALYYLDIFKNNITRDNYKNAYYYISILINEDVKNEYLNELSTYKEKLDVIEEETARNNLTTFENNLTLDNYDMTKESIDILDNETIKLELTTKLEELYIKLEQKEKVNNYIRWTVGIIFLGLIIYLIYYMYKKYKKDPEVEFNNEYYRDIPDNATPEQVSYLFSRSINEDALSASIMDLIRRKIIIQEKIDDKNYTLKLNGKREDLDKKDNSIIALIFNNKDTITTKELKKRARSGYNTFLRLYDDYKSEALKSAINQKYFEQDIEDLKESKNSKDTLVVGVILVVSLFISIWLFLGLLIIYGIYLFIKRSNKSMVPYIYVISIILNIIISIIIGISNIMYKNSIFIYLIVTLVSIYGLIWYFIPQKRTYEGALSYKKWKALEKFLKEFGSFSDKEVPDIVLWEKYLVYATLFGCAKEVSKVMKLRVEEYGMNDTYNFDYLDYYYINRFISSAVRDSVASARSAQSYHNSSSSSSGSWSSGSGGGGGFSSGGGSFGGGGGGGRF